MDIVIQNTLTMEEVHYRKEKSQMIIVANEMFKDPKFKCIRSQQSLKWLMLETFERLFHPQDGSITNPKEDEDAKS